MRARKNIVWSVALVALVGIGWLARVDAQWHPPFPYPYYRFDPGAALRIEVTPNDAEVYVDGYYAGVVDDFDGVFQRLSVEPGEHEIALYLDGYRTFKQRVYAAPRRTFHMKQKLERLPAGEAQGPRPEPPNPPAGAGAPPRRQSPAPPSARRPAASATGSIEIHVQPADADILIDGQKWRGPAGQDPVEIDVPEGRHTVEAQKTGYRTYITDVEVRRGTTTGLNITLKAQN